MNEPEVTSAFHYDQNREMAIISHTLQRLFLTTFVRTVLPFAILHISIKVEILILLADLQSNNKEVNVALTDIAICW